MTAARTARRKNHPSRTPLIGRRLPGASHCPSLLAHNNRRPTPRRPFRSSSCPPTPCCPSLPPNPVPPAHHPSDACCGQIPIEPAAPPLPTKRDFVPWRFSDACRRRTWMATSCRRPRNLHNFRKREPVNLCPLGSLIRLPAEYLPLQTV